MRRRRCTKGMGRGGAVPATATWVRRAGRTGTETGSKSTGSCPESAGCGFVPDSCGGTERSAMALGDGARRHRRAARERLRRHPVRRPGPALVGRWVETHVASAACRRSRAAGVHGSLSTPCDCAIQHPACRRSCGIFEPSAPHRGLICAVCFPYRRPILAPCVRYVCGMLGPSRAIAGHPRAISTASENARERTLHACGVVE